MSKALDIAAGDPFLWLEDVAGDAALAWVREHSQVAEGALMAQPEYPDIHAAVLESLESQDRIPQVSRRGDHLYNLWQDAQHPRGLWRRTTLADYALAEPAWESVLDLDALCAAEGESWVWAGAVALGPAYARCLLRLSRGGADAVVVREFDLVERAFVAEGFVIAEAKTDVTWLDLDTLLVGSDFGPGTLTDSGYPRTLRRWQRGTALADAETVFAGEPGDVAVSAWVDRTPDHERRGFSRALDFFSNRLFVVQADGALAEIDKPLDADVGFMREWMLLQLRSPWQVGEVAYAAGTLIACDAAAHARGERRFHVLFEPTATRSLAGYALTRSHVLLNVLDQVVGEVEECRWDGHAWQHRRVAVPRPGSIGLQSLHDPLRTDDPLGDHYLMSYTDFLAPDSLMLATAGSDERSALKRRPAFFDASRMRAEQRFAQSKDGTQVPYFVVHPGGANDEPRPTLLYGYGGFEVSLQPWYLGAQGRNWLGRGGVLAVANIRGGGEFGPAWHEAALKAHRQRSYDDFIAIAEDLIARGITQPARLGIMGGSNGGLLVGAVTMQRPELFNAVVCSVPLLDMRRYHRLLAGASWMAEYGDPDDPEQWAWIKAYSPYQNVHTDRRYPRILFMTSTRDDRVHPGHARKMAAKMLAQGHPLLYWENTEGGHGGAADARQRAHMQALQYSYLWQQLGAAR